MRSELKIVALLGVAAFMGCAHGGQYASTRCPHCHQVHADAPAPAMSTAVASANVQNAGMQDAPVPYVSGTSLQDIPPVPAAAEE